VTEIGTVRQTATQDNVK
jgi:hypothetical protein